MMVPSAQFVAPRLRAAQLREAASAAEQQAASFAGLGLGDAAGALKCAAQDARRKADEDELLFGWADTPAALAAHAKEAAARAMSAAQQAEAAARALPVGQHVSAAAAAAGAAAAAAAATAAAAQAVTTAVAAAPCSDGYAGNANLLPRPQPASFAQLASQAFKVGGTKAVKWRVSSFDDAYACRDKMGEQLKCPRGEVPLHHSTRSVHAGYLEAKPRQAHVA